MLARIVVIEDDVYMREELIDMLKKAGYDAVPLPAFENAVSQLAELSPDLILLDINLPFRSGFEICKEIKAKHLGAVLILTARDKLQDELHALGLGADDYLTKPCNMERLLARTKNLLRRREPTPWARPSATSRTTGTSSSTRTTTISSVAASGTGWTSLSIALPTSCVACGRRMVSTTGWRATTTIPPSLSATASRAISSTTESSRPTVRGRPN